ncbi:MAG: CoA transferase [Dehalococcoidia bacterium]|nr:CoA transferase [Dehalococcoidia bacterium]
MSFEARTGLPLEGIRVLDITQSWAGPGASMLLADWGAEVIRLESLNFFPMATRGWMARPSKEYIRTNDSWRMAYWNWEPGPRPWNRWPMFQSTSRNKLSMTVDTQGPEGAAVFDEMMRVSDVLVENNGPGVLEKMGITYERMRRLRPDALLVRMPAFGLSGRYAGFRAYGFQMEGVAGHTWLQGYPDMDLSSRGLTYIADAVAGLSAALATVAALAQRRETGKGQVVEVSQTEGLVPMIEEAVLDFQMNGRVQTALRNRDGRHAPQGCYPCAGVDHWIAIAVGSDEEWRGLCRTMERPELAGDARFRHTLARWKHQDELDAIISEWTRQHEHVALMERLQAGGVPAGVVMDDRDLFADRQLAAREFFNVLSNSDSGSHPYPGLMWKSSGTGNRLRLAPCMLGEHNGYAYRELLGKSDGEYAALEKQGQIGMDFAPHIR